VIRELTTRPVSNPSDAAQPPMPPQPSEAVQAEAAPPAPPAAEAAPSEAPPMQITPIPAREPVASRLVTNAEEDAAATLRWLLAAFAIIGFLVCGGYFVMEMIRRRSDVLNRVVDRDALPLELSPQTAPSDEAPTFEPLPPMRMTEREDDIDAAMRRFVQNSRRRAA
jgi:hypothetical protein